MMGVFGSGFWHGGHFRILKRWHRLDRILRRAGKHQLSIHEIKLLDRDRDVMMGVAVLSMQNLVVAARRAA
jgi:hypothetical protein